MFSKGVYILVNTYLLTLILIIFDRTLDRLEAFSKRIGTTLRPSNKRGLGHGDGDRGEKDMESTYSEKDIESTYSEKDIGNDMDGEKDIESIYSEKDIGNNMDGEKDSTYGEKGIY